MNYEFRGTLCGYLCADCQEALAGVTVRLYRNRPDQGVTGLAVAPPKDTLAMLGAGEAQAKAGSLIAETVADADGKFVFRLGAEQKYEGGAFEIDVYCGTVPHRKPMKNPPPPVQFSITTLQPMWKQTDAGAVAYWEYCVPARFWCGVRQRLGAWTICGHVRICNARQPTPVAGVTVRAFDVDWTQDDPLGAGVTDANGHFRIDYLAIDFMRTPFPSLNIELFGGPDVYFSIEDSGGGVLLQEPRSRGRDPDRADRGPCFCVDLCVDKPVTVDHAWFTHVGDFDIYADIDATTGLTKWAAPIGMADAHGGPGYGFYDGISGSGLKLIGDCPAVYPGGTSPMRYRFTYVNPAVSPTPVPITGAAVNAVVVGDRAITWRFGAGPLVTTFQSIQVAPSGGSATIPPPPAPPPPGPFLPVPPAVIVPDADGWVIVPPDVNGGMLSGPLLRFVSAAAVPGGAGSAPGDSAGNPIATPRNGQTLSIIFEAEPVTGPSAAEPTLTNSLPKILINNWSQANLLNISQFTLPGSDCCTPLSTDLGIRYTADHQLMKGWSVSITSCATGKGWVSPATPSGTGPRGGFGTDNIPIGTWPGCSYTVWLSSVRSVTDGEQDDTGATSQITFCIDR
ncbi:MAG: hypothetical protein JSR21_05630 [Proteobacteria bacterium]|nr:hypothetical protein [Pseudomonadota bacterium]